MSQQQDSIYLEYIWLDAKNNLRSKMRTIGAEYLMIADIVSLIKRSLNRDLSNHSFNLPTHLRWSYDGSSTGQASGHDSEVILEPIYICPNEYKNAKYGVNAKYYFALCEILDKNNVALYNNHYATIKNAIRENEMEEYYFSFEQEFFIMNKNPYNVTQMTNIPIGMPLPNEEGLACNHQTTQQYYCSVGSENIVYHARELVERVYHWGIRSGLILSGYNAEVAIGQWEIQVGPSANIRACHELWIIRYMLKTMAEEYGYCISLHPKPLENWNGSGLHTNFSNQKMRHKKQNESDLDAKGYDYIVYYCNQLSASHRETMTKYGEDNQLRMTGGYETASYDNYTYGVANRGCSIRIPRNVFINQCGYIEDRRPASNADPYLIYNVLTTAANMGD